MDQLIIQYKKAYIQLPDNDLDALALAKDTIRFFIEREKERLKNETAP